MAAPFDSRSEERSTSTESGELPTFTEPGVMSGGTADLDIDVLGGQPIHVTIEELGERGRGIVLNETYREEYTLDFGDNESLFLKHGNYRVTIRVNGTVQWNETITHHETYDLRVEENGSVTVTGHGEM